MSAELVKQKDAVTDAKRASKSQREELKQTKRTCNTLETKVAKWKKDAETAKRSGKEKAAKIEQLRTELSRAKREKKQASVTHGATDVRLHRAQEENAKLKAQVRTLQRDQRDAGQRLKEEAKRLGKENQVLKKQKSELIEAFKAQLKLIEVLKRQKVHIEAARVLNFSEDEFVKALEWGG